jgi:lipocalin
MEDALYKELLEKIKTNGFDIDKLIKNEPECVK